MTHLTSTALHTRGVLSGGSYCSLLLLGSFGFSIRHEISSCNNTGRAFFQLYTIVIHCCYIPIVLHHLKALVMGRGCESSSCDAEKLTLKALILTSYECK